MIVSITCPYCKTRNAIKADVSADDVCDIDYPSNCPVCNHPIGIDEIADLQGQCLQDIHDSMTESIYERAKDQEIDEMIRRQCKP